MGSAGTGQGQVEVVIAETNHLSVSYSQSRENSFTMNIETCSDATFVQQFVKIESELAEDLENMERERESKVKFVLNPLDYAQDPHIKFLNKYLVGPRRVLFVGLNPGPWGMCQTGIPFGDVGQCKDFLQITGLTSDIISLRCFS